jgi:hypothetical protein
LNQLTATAILARKEVIINENGDILNKWFFERNDVVNNKKNNQVNINI